MLGDKKHNICIIEKYNVNVSFIMFIDSAGSTAFYREEKFHAKSKEFENLERRIMTILFYKHADNKMANHNIVSLKWLLGELLFDRLKTNN